MKTNHTAASYYFSFLIICTQPKAPFLQNGQHQGENHAF